MLREVDPLTPDEDAAVRAAARAQFAREAIVDRPIPEPVLHPANSPRMVYVPPTNAAAPSTGGLSMLTKVGLGLAGAASAFFLYRTLVKS